MNTLHLRRGGESNGTGPALLLDDSGIAALKVRITRAPWARQEWERLRSGIETAMKSPVELPPRGGNWSHNYVCPVHGARLKRGKQIGPWRWEHICPVGPHTLTGDPAKGAQHDFDGNAISEVHGTNARRIADGGLLTRVTGNPAGADFGRKILLAYADQYRRYPYHDNQGRPGKVGNGKGGRVASQSLTEASWLIEMAQGASLVWPTLSPAERQHVENDLFRAALTDVILPSHIGIHNIQCRLNSAIGLAGFLLGDQGLISKAIDDPKIGYRQQLAQGVLEDGMWLEGSSGYHFFTMEGLWPLAEAARLHGLDLYGPKYKAMFDAPFDFAMPDLVLPDFNDSNPVKLISQADLYELGYARFRNPVYLQLLRKSPRTGRMALLFGEPDLPTSGGSSRGESHNSEASGYAVLQKGNGEAATWVCVKYGPHGGGHGHPDKNHFLLYTRGDIIAPDGGTHAYGSPLHSSWDKATAAHNTLVVDTESQKPTKGKSLAFGREADADYSVTDAGEIYPGIRFVRSVFLLSPTLLVLVDQVKADAEHTLDIVYHQVGTWDSLPAGQPWMPPKTPGYRFLEGATSRPLPAEGLILSGKKMGSLQPRITLCAAPVPTEVITGLGIHGSTEDRIPMLIQRRRATATTYIWAISLDGADCRLTAVPAMPDSAAAAKVTQGGTTWTLVANPDSQNLSAPFATKAIASVRRG